MKKYCLLILVLFFTSCTGTKLMWENNCIISLDLLQQQYAKNGAKTNYFMDLNSAITELSNQILINNIIKQNQKR